MAVNCNNGTLNVYVPDQDNPWNISKVLFVFRRLGFSVKFKEVKNYLNYNPNDLIDELFDPVSYTHLTLPTMIGV